MLPSMGLTIFSLLVPYIIRVDMWGPGSDCQVSLTLVMFVSLFIECVLPCREE